MFILNPEQGCLSMQMIMCMEKSVMICLQGKYILIINQAHQLIDSFANRHTNHHDHSDNIDLADLVLDTEHILDDLDIYTERELDSMNVDEKVCLSKFEQI